MSSSPVGKDDRTTWEKVSDYFVNDGVKIVWIILWFAGTSAAFLERYIHYYKPDDDKAPYAVLGQGLPMARGAAAALKLNTALLLVTMLRNFLSFIRGTWLGSLLPVDKSIVFHRYIAWTCAFFCCMAHLGSHVQLQQNLHFNSRQHPDFESCLYCSPNCNETSLDHITWSNRGGCHYGDGADV